jgi:hypothetical protein
MKKLIFMAVIALLLTSCGKYEEGPGFSLKSKTKRLAREWTISKVIENGVDITDAYKNMVKTHELKFMETGSLKETINTAILAKGWEWGDKKETIRIYWTLIGVDHEVTHTILQLSSKEYWYRTVLDEKDYEFHWSAK